MERPAAHLEISATPCGSCGSAARKTTADHLNRKIFASFNRFLVGGLVAIFGIFPEILGIIMLIDVHIFQRGG